MAEKEERILIARSTDYTLTDTDKGELFEGKIAPHCMVFLKVDKNFWNPFNGWPFDALYEAVGRGLKHGKNKKGKRNIRLRGRSKR